MHHLIKGYLEIYVFTLKPVYVLEIEWFIVDKFIRCKFMNFFRLFENGIYNLNKIKSITLRKNYRGRQYARIVWADQNISGNFFFFSSDSTAERIYKDESPYAYERLEKLSENIEYSKTSVIEPSNQPHEY